MHLENENYKITIDNNAQVSSILFKEKEILYQGNETWKKRFPIIFPSLGKSAGYEYNGKKYNMPKHGWWKDLTWESFFENGELLSVATIMDTELFPFMFDITQRITLNDTDIVISYEFTNLSKETAYFQFGIHPAFKIDDSSYIESNEDYKEIDLKGLITKNTINPNEIVLKEMPFGKSFDTLIATNVKKKHISLINKEEIISIKFDSPHLQLWKPNEDNFICIEPWYGWNDSYENTVPDITKKKEIITLETGRTWVASIEMTVKINNEATKN